MIRIGKNQQDNWDILDAADDSDIWFHVRDYPSAHVILKTDTLSPALVLQCAQECKKRSKAKHLANVYVIYTERKNVQKSSAIGSVTTRNVHTIRVS